METLLFSISSSNLKASFCDQEGYLQVYKQLIHLHPWSIYFIKSPACIYLLVFVCWSHKWSKHQFREWPWRHLGSFSSGSFLTKAAFEARTWTMTTPVSSSVCICIGQRNCFESPLICSVRKVLFKLADAFIYLVVERNLKPAPVCNCADSCRDLTSGFDSGNTLCFLALN